MNTLHIINAPQTPAGFTTTLSRFSPMDSVIFIQDGCYGLNAPEIITAMSALTITVYAIDDDLSARNVLITEAIKAIDYDAFVDLTLAHHKTISW